VTTLPDAAPVVRPPAAVADPLTGVRRPNRRLLFYYFLQSILAGPGIIVLLPIRYFRYRTLRYAFDAEGLTVRWGILFRREVSLTYARIQDIHLVSNLVERWLALGRVQIQTASGSADAEVTIQGLPDFEAVRDELYRRMRGARGSSSSTALTHASTPGDVAAHDIVTALNEAVAELRALRQSIERRGGA
jgi:putative membrane protein